MARVFLARVDELSPQAVEEALAMGLSFLGAGGAGPWSVVADPELGSSKSTKSLPGQVAHHLRSAGVQASSFPALPRGTGCSRYQLTVGAPGQRIDAHEALFGASSLALVGGLRRDSLLGGAGGALSAGARALLPEPLSSMTAQKVELALGGLLEVADPDLVVGDGRRVALGDALDSPRSHALGLMILADNALAHDLVWSSVLGASRGRTRWLERLAELGFGPDSLDEIEMGGEELSFFQRRIEGFGVDSPRWRDVPSGYQRATGVPLPIDVIPSAGGPASARAHAWLASHTEHPTRREAMKACVPFAILAGAREPGALPRHDKVLAIGPEAAHSILADVHIDRARQRPSWLAVVRGSSAELWDLRVSDGRTLLLAALTDPAPSVARIGRAAAVLTGQRWLCWPRESRLAAIWGWLVRRVRRSDIPPPLVHARRIRRLQDRPWRAQRLAGPLLREEADVA